MSFEPIEMGTVNRGASCTIAYRHRADQKRVYLSLSAAALKRAGLAVGGRVVVLVGNGDDRGKLRLTSSEMCPGGTLLKIQDFYRSSRRNAKNGGQRGLVVVAPWFRRAAPIPCQEAEVAYPEEGYLEIALPEAFIAKPNLEIRKAG